MPEHIDKLQEPQKSPNITYRTRRKRQAGTPKIEPELLLFVDYALFKDFGGDSNELLEYLLHFWHSVSIMYLHFNCNIPKTIDDIDTNIFKLYHLFV